MWPRFKLWMLSVSLRVAVVIVPGLIIADAFIIRNYERFVADPLQVRGISLAWQMKGIYIGGAFCFLFARPLSLFNFFPFIIWLTTGVFTRFSALELDPREELQRNAAKIIIWLVLIRWVIYWLAIFVIMASGYFRFLLVVAIIVTLSCDPKPPRPKRLKRLVHATEGI